MKKLLLFLPLLVACSTPTTEINVGALQATCNWNGVCDTENRYFEYEDEDIRIWLVFSAAIDDDASFASLEQNLLVAEVDFKRGALAPSDACGQTVPEGALFNFADGRLSGQITGKVKRCDVNDDILTDREQMDFEVLFDLSFDPTQQPRN